MPPGSGSGLRARENGMMRRAFQALGFGYDPGSSKRRVFLIKPGGTGMSQVREFGGASCFRSRDVSGTREK